MMFTFVVILASILLLGGICWLFIDKIIFWLAKKLHKETKTISSFNALPFKLMLWRFRLSGILWIIFALFLFFMALEPEFLTRVPSYAVIIVIALPILAGFILVRVASTLLRRKSPPS